MEQRWLTGPLIIGHIIKITNQYDCRFVAMQSPKDLPCGRVWGCKGLRKEVGNKKNWFIGS